MTPITSVSSYQALYQPQQSANNPMPSARGETGTSVPANNNARISNRISNEVALQTPTQEVSRPVESSMPELRTPTPNQTQTQNQNQNPTGTGTGTSSQQQAGTSSQTNLTPTLQALAQNASAATDSPPAMAGQALDSMGDGPTSGPAALSLTALSLTQGADGNGRVSLNDFSATPGDSTPDSTGATARISAQTRGPAQQDSDINEQVRQNVSRLMESYGGPARNGDAAAYSSFSASA